MAPPCVGEGAHVGGTPARSALRLSSLGYPFNLVYLMSSHCC
jgi:hypothetical protein